MKEVKKYLVFEVMEGLFGINLKYILKVKNNVKCYKLPAIEEKYLGVIQFENRFIPIVKFNETDSLEPNEINTVLILRYRINEFAVHIKNVIDIYDIANEDIFNDGKRHIFIEEKRINLINLEDFIGGKK